MCIAGCLLVAGTARAEEPEDWNLKVQSTYVRQLKPGLASPYQGEHSLRGARETSYSFTATAALGWRLGPRTEVYLNPEAAQGVPLSGLTGLGGFTNGEMARTSGATLSVYRARLFVRHAVGLGKETEPVESAMNQLGGRQATRRWVFTAGNVSVLDIFDANRYSHDPRTQFLNWTVMTHGAYDFAADARGYTWGAATEYIDSGWALRLGRFIQPREANQLALDPRIFRRYGDQIELTREHTIGEDAPGAVRLLAYRNRARMARYDDALARAAARGEVPAIDAGVRNAEQVKVGLGVNVEQSIGRTLGLFGRAMWADGKTETYAFTEADRSLSLGAVLGGSRWGRQADALGLAFATNRLSSGHREVLARGGLTFFLGDGRLRYAPERIVEAYYAWKPSDPLTLTVDLQHIRNPGYNADRGPARFVGVRTHVEF
jgi:hypothetical protein